jgi:hypothetical protein
LEHSEQIKGAGGLKIESGSRGTIPAFSKVSSSSTHFVSVWWQLSKIIRFWAMNDEEEDTRRGVEELPRRDIEMRMTANESTCGTIYNHLHLLEMEEDDDGGQRSSDHY